MLGRANRAGSERPLRQAAVVARVLSDWDVAKWVLHNRTSREGGSFTVSMTGGAWQMCAALRSMYRVQVGSGPSAKEKEEE